MHRQETDGNTSINVAGGWDMTGGVFTSTATTVTFDGSSADQTITSGGLSV